MTCVALIPAAGRGSRIAGAQPKQYAALAGRPMLWHAVAAVCRTPVETVFVVLAPGDTAFKSCDWSAFAGRLEPLYCGGETRRDSVYNGLVAAMGHDPLLLTPERVADIHQKGGSILGKTPEMVTTNERATLH